MHGCMDAWMYACTYVCMYACMYACMLLCTYASMHLCIYACMCEANHLRSENCRLEQLWWHEFSLISGWLSFGAQDALFQANPIHSIAMPC